MLNAGEELFLFEGEFFKLFRKYFEMDKYSRNTETMLGDIDVIHRKYKGINKLYDEYILTRFEWFLKMMTIKERYEDGEL